MPSCMRYSSSIVDAQPLCRIGHWELDLASQKLSWSDELYELLGLMPGSFDGSYETFLRRFTLPTVLITSSVGNKPHVAVQSLTLSTAL